LLHPLLSLFLMLCGFLASYAITALAIAYGSWPIYSIPFVSATLVGWLATRKRAKTGLEYDDKNFAKSQDALEYILREVESRET